MHPKYRIDIDVFKTLVEQAKIAFPSERETTIIVLIIYNFFSDQSMALNKEKPHECK